MGLLLLRELQIELHKNLSNCLVSILNLIYI